ncbi:NAD(P)/FAD-dependent oxidoreductase [Seohaeicola zhoushanensis]|uniref:Pyridine nucleotide-disulfide oxidoreductase n=1 Tax=Seohaeicola zhoushanensis TaxID=1569283 RepID=A0A8J3H438_9RHOB|nr:FAD-dependent oxidoreductase [Seohaeicola zhoushanensis]GHF76402.1 pyridine nucleotide-disulfide oxidoreductase [Seohaeicola zhoushanensis]
MQNIVILGAGQAGFQTAASLRQLGFDGTIRLVGDEPGLPYQRPPLSKAYLLGKTDTAGLQFRPDTYFADSRVALIEDTASAIDRTAKRVSLARGEALEYDHLVIATGARNRLLPVPGADLGGVMGLRTLADADRLGEKLKQVEDVVVVGAGFIGLEFAAVAATLGKTVHVVELADRPMQRAVSAAMSDCFTVAHRNWGVTLHLGAALARLTGKRQVSGVELADGSHIAAGLVVYGIGVQPNAEIAQAAGLHAPNGITVDAFLRTPDPAVSAIGDCALFPCAQAGGQAIRLESVQNAADQARALAANLTGTRTPYTALPWFWSDQGDLKLQMVGLSKGHDRTVTLGDTGARAFSTLLFRDNRLIATESVNRPADFMIARKLLGTPGRALPTPDEAASESFDMRAWEKAIAPHPERNSA